jgi:hypothetical protein
MPSAQLPFVVVAAASLTACAQPLPADRAAYAGEWSGPGTILSITLGGDLAFEQTTRGTTIEILGPIKAFDGDDIVVGFAFVTSTIDVTSPPAEHDGAWTMAVSGVALTKH